MTPTKRKDHTMSALIAHLLHMLHLAHLEHLRHIHWRCFVMIGHHRVCK